MATNGSEKATIMEMQNLRLFYKLHMPKWQLPILTGVLKFGTLLRIVIYTILGKLNIARIYYKALNLH